jgi:predicted nucleic-acid-binding protein
MIGLDTNVLLRYLLQDDPAQAELANSRMEQLDTDENRGFINLVVLCETLWVLTRGYHYSRNDIDGVVEQILLTQEFEIENRTLAWGALHDFRNGRADFADCLIGRLNAAAGCAQTISFDQGTRDLPGFEIL